MFWRKRMNRKRALDLVLHRIEPHSVEQMIEAWQFLHDTGLAYQLQGSFGRMARDLIAQGIISE